jgi:hypothetical protein
MNKTFREIRKKYEWPNRKRDIENYVKKCKICQVNKTLGPRHRAPMEITTTARKPFERCAMDIVGPTTMTDKGNRYIFTFQDDLTKFIVAEPIPMKDVETVAREFVRNIVLKFGIPEVVLTDLLTPPMFTMSILTEPRATRRSSYYLGIGHGYHLPCKSNPHPGITMTTM